jgi:hypothetical protein
MTEQEEKKTSVEYLLDLLGNREDFDYIKFDQICSNAWKKYENELKEAYEKGVKYTDDIISDERFPF